MTTLEILRGMRELLAVPERWTREYYALDKDGEFCGPRSDGAICWCILGAAEVAGAGLAPQIDAAMKVLYPLMGDSVVVFNEQASHAEVLAVLDKAIELEAAR